MPILTPDFQYNSCLNDLGYFSSDFYFLIPAQEKNIWTMNILDFWYIVFEISWIKFAYFLSKLMLVIFLHQTNKNILNNDLQYSYFFNFSNNPLILGLLYSFFQSICFVIFRFRKIMNDWGGRNVVACFKVLYCTYKYFAAFYFRKHFIEI